MLENSVELPQKMPSLRTLTIRPCQNVDVSNVKEKLSFTTEAVNDVFKRIFSSWCKLDIADYFLRT